MVADAGTFLDDWDGAFAGPFGKWFISAVFDGRYADCGGKGLVFGAWVNGLAGWVVVLGLGGLDDGARQLYWGIRGECVGVGVLLGLVFCFGGLDFLAVGVRVVAMDGGDEAAFLQVNLGGFRIWRSRWT